MSRISGLTENNAASQLVGFLIVALTMIEMFTIPKPYFVLGSIVSTGVMSFVAYLATDDLFGKPKLNASKIAFGVGTAIILYLVFYLGNLALTNLTLPGIRATNELTIYGLFSNV